MARSAISMSPNCVAKELKIQPGYVQAIEALDRNALPPIGYVLGYVRAYAGLVGIDPKQAVEDFKTDSEVPENLGMRDRPHFVPKRQLRLPKGFFAAATLLACGAVLATWYASKTDAQATALTTTATITAPAEIPVAAEIDPDRMLIKATAPSWVEIRDKDGQRLISRILVIGESWEASKDAGVSLSARDAGALDLYIGKDLMGQLGPKGVSIENVPMPGIHPEFMTEKARTVEGLPRIEIEFATTQPEGEQQPK